jgi:EAL domain-containing protein (putative c-di-GMP-specific phosphodiesterase class I)
LVDLRGGRVVAAEALVRWVHPTRGLLGPDSFIPLAEETGRISRLTQAVLFRACGLAARWPAEPGTTVRPSVSVNLSARDFDNPGLVALVLEALARSGLEPERLILEITETLMLSDTSRSIETLRELAATGVRIALDDFGTGYSSLNYLGQLPLHWIKIAKTFVDDLGSDSAHDALAQGIVELGHILQLGIIAEGIERPEQLATLQRFGCDIGQGFLFGHPMSPSDFLEWLHQYHSSAQEGLAAHPMELEVITGQPGLPSETRQLHIVRDHIARDDIVRDRSDGRFGRFESSMVAGMGRVAAPCHASTYTAPEMRPASYL